MYCKISSILNLLMFEKSLLTELLVSANKLNDKKIMAIILNIELPYFIFKIFYIKKIKKKLFEAKFKKFDKSFLSQEKITDENII